MRSICVTGAAGFIGHHLVTALKQSGHFVVALDDFSRGSESNLAKVSDVVFQADITSKSQLDGKFSGIDSVIHLAAVNGTKNFYQQPKRVFEVGLLGTINVIRESINSSVSTLVFASSAEVYGSPSKVPTSEEDAFLVSTNYIPRYSYGGSKLIGELMMNFWAKDEIERVITFRPHNVYGARMGFDHVIPRIVKSLLDERTHKRGSNQKVKLEIQGDGSEVRSFAYVDDIVRGIELLLDKGQSGEIYHLGNPEPITILDLANLIAEKLQLNLDISFGPRLPDSPLVRIPDIRKAQSIGFDPQVSLSDGIQRFINSMIFQGN